MKYDKNRTSSHELMSHHEGVIHDVNNILWAICCMAELIKEEIPKKHACQEKVKTIVQAAQRCSILLSTSIPTKAQSLEMNEEFDLISIVKEVITLIAYTPQLNVKIVVNHENENVTVYGNKSEISSALMNLCLNAIEAMPDGGILQIESYLIKKANTSNSPDKNNTKVEEYIIVDIKDTGIGIPPENLPRIFEPHFSTKGSVKKKNWGMGLWRVKRCVSQHGGAIHVSSCQGKGTTFSLRLPVAFVLNEQNSRALSCKSKIQKTKKVIVIDSDETIRDIITAMLNKEYIDVIEHSDHNSAISWISEHIGHANIAIIEHSYPVYNGTVIAKTLQAIDPNLKCILCSDTTDIYLHMNYKGVLLVKPFLKKELFDTLNITLSENRH